MTGPAQVSARRSRLASVSSHHVRLVLSGGMFRRLFATRLLGQFGDGVFQASLAGAVLFNPDRQANAADIATGFAVVLLPYSLIGPFAGVLMDRWWRKRVLVWANVLRALAVIGVAAEVAAGYQGEGFFASALVVISLNRFFLSGLSAALPHAVAPGELVTANAFSTTMGGIATTIGGAAAIGVRAGVGDTNAAYATIAVAAAIPYLASAFAASGFTRSALGPDDSERQGRESLRQVVRGLAAGARHIAHKRSAFAALLATGAYRFFYGLVTICTILLYRNYFRDDGVFRTGLAGLAQIVLAIAVGAGLAAAVTPSAVRSFGIVRWVAGLFALAGVAEIALGLPFSQPLLILGAFVLGGVAQGSKIAVDTLVQASIEDEFRGRVFSLYDTMFNVAFVGAAIVTALVAPADGRSTALVAVVGVAFLLIAAIYLRTANRRAPEDVGAPGGEVAQPGSC